MSRWLIATARRLCQLNSCSLKSNRIKRFQRVRFGFLNRDPWVARFLGVRLARYAWDTVPSGITVLKSFANRRFLVLTFKPNKFALLKLQPAKLTFANSEF